MKLIVTLADDGGMMFNHRRHSRDGAVCSDILELTKGYRLVTSSYTASLFDDYGADIIVANKPLSKAKRGDFCFAEECVNLTEAVEVIVIYKWNRKYPGDVFFHIDLSRYELENSKDFPGNSHEKITREVWKLKNE